MKKKDILSDGIGQINDSILERFDRIEKDIDGHKRVRGGVRRPIWMYAVAACLALVIAATPAITNMLTSKYDPFAPGSSDSGETPELSGQVSDPITPPESTPSANESSGTSESTPSPETTPEDTSPAEYPISYDMNDGKNNADNPSSILSDEELILYPPSRENFEFLGWTWEGQLEPMQIVILNGIDREMHFTANWMPSSGLAELFGEGKHEEIYTIEGGTPTLDGEKDAEYKYSRPVYVRNARGDIVATAYFLWDDNGLYFHIEVSDTTGDITKADSFDAASYMDVFEARQFDSVEIVTQLCDFDPSASDIVGGENGYGRFRIYRNARAVNFSTDTPIGNEMNYADGEGGGYGKWLYNNTKDHTPEDGACRLISWDDSEGYGFEGFIEWNPELGFEIGEITNKVIGIGIIVNDEDSYSSLKSEIMYSENSGGEEILMTENRAGLGKFRLCRSWPALPAPDMIYGEGTHGELYPIEYYTPIIDGELDAAYKYSRVVHLRDNGDKYARGTIYFLWDDSALYFHVTILDSAMHMPDLAGNHGETIDMMFSLADFDTSATQIVPKRADDFGDAQFRVFSNKVISRCTTLVDNGINYSLGDYGGFGKWVWENTNMDDPESGSNYIVHNVTENGFTFEGFVKWSPELLESDSINNGSIIGIGIQYDDDINDDGQRDLKCYNENAAPNNWSMSGNRATCGKFILVHRELRS